MQRKSSMSITRTTPYSVGIRSVALLVPSASLVSTKSAIAVSCAPTYCAISVLARRRHSIRCKNTSKNRRPSALKLSRLAKPTSRRASSMNFADFILCAMFFTNQLFQIHSKPPFVRLGTVSASRHARFLAGCRRQLAGLSTQASTGRRTAYHSHSAEGKAILMWSKKLLDA